MITLPEIADWRQRAAALAVLLTENGALTDPRWRAAIENTPRHLFVPRIDRGQGVVIDGTNGHIDEWLDAVYSDDSLVVQRANAAGVEDWPTSSSTMPSLMVRMLELLNVTDDSRVLEIGTATGYNAALLCHRLGADKVASIELHPGLAAATATHLSALGYRPDLAVGDGVDGLPAGAPYDRIIATCAVSTVPPAWIAQLAPGGRIVTDLRSEMSSSLAVLEKTGPDMASGQLLEHPGNFMWLRPDADTPLLDADRFNFVVDLDNAQVSPLTIDPRLLDEPGARLLLGILEPSLSTPSRSTRDGTEVRWMHAHGGAWVEIVDQTVTQGGPRQLWPAIERAIAEWLRLGKPGRGRFGLTISEGVHRYWADDPTNAVYPGHS